MTAPPRLLQRVRAVGDLSVGQLSLVELQQEIKRRIENLREQRQELEQKIDAIDRELTSIGAFDSAGSAPNGIRPRVRGARGANAEPLKVVLARVLRERPLRTREAAEAVLADGYVTSSKNFPNTVSVALHREEQFERRDGKWFVNELGAPETSETDTIDDPSADPIAVSGAEEEE